MSNVLELRGITRVYETASGRVDVLRGTDFSLAAGELVALIGPSGCGKSTLLHVAGLLDRPQAGAIWIAGEEVTHANDNTCTKLRNRHLGFIYQFHNLLPELSACENVMIPLRIGGVAVLEARARAEKLLARLGLAARLTHYPSQLSGGEQQRVAIARALAMNPPIILADEPTGNLDPETSHAVIALLLEVAKEQGVSALIATHNMALAAKLNRAVTLRGGTIEEARL